MSGQPIYTEAIGPFDDSAHDPSNPWNIPDWRDAEIYPTKEGTPIHRWRWQFLRRSEAYRNVWTEYQKNRVAWFADDNGNPARRDLEAKRFNLSYLINPACDYVRDEFGIFAEQIGARVMPAWYVEKDVKDFVEQAACRGLYLAAIDPEAPIEAQLKLIKDEVKREAKSWAEELSLGQGATAQRRERGDAWQLYLRLLDARDYARAKWVEIECVMKTEKSSRGIDSLRTSYKLAKRCRDEFVGEGHK